MTKKAQPSDVW